MPFYIVHTFIFCNPLHRKKIDEEMVEYSNKKERKAQNIHKKYHHILEIHSLLAPFLEPVVSHHTFPDYEIIRFELPFFSF